MWFVDIPNAACCTVPGLLQGCGLITYKDRGSAGAAIQQLHGEYIFPGSDCPLVVEWMDLKKQRPAGAATLFLGVVNSRCAALQCTQTGCHTMLSQQQFGCQSTSCVTQSTSHCCATIQGLCLMCVLCLTLLCTAILPPVDKPPMGCACDTLKLLLSNIPVGVTESALVGALSQFGPVVQLGLTPDPAGVSVCGVLYKLCCGSGFCACLKPCLKLSM